VQAAFKKVTTCSSYIMTLCVCMLIGSFRVFDLGLLLRARLLDAHTATATNATGPTTAPTMTCVETAAELAEGEEEDFEESYIIYILYICIYYNIARKTFELPGL
jgi:hypothetical protein